MEGLRQKRESEVDKNGSWKVNECVDGDCKDDGRENSIAALGLGERVMVKDLGTIYNVRR